MATKKTITAPVTREQMVKWLSLMAAQQAAAAKQAAETLQGLVVEPSNVVRLPMHGTATRPRRSHEPVGSEAIHPMREQRRQNIACEQVVATLELLLSHARKGQITGLAWAASLPKGLRPDGVRMACHTVGEAARDPHFGSEMARGLLSKVEAIRRGERVEH